jgi:hypothetical protein
VDEFVSHDGLLELGRDPVEEIDGFVVGVIPSLDLLLVEAEHVLAEIEVAGEKPELFEGAGGAVEALAISLLLEAALDVFGDIFAGGQLLFDGVEDGESGLEAGELEDVVDGGEELLGLLRGEMVLLGGGGCGILSWSCVLRGSEKGEQEEERSELAEAAAESCTRAGRKRHGETITLREAAGARAGARARSKTPP